MCFPLIFRVVLGYGLHEMGLLGVLAGCAHTAQVPIRTLAEGRPMPFVTADANRAWVTGWCRSDESCTQQIRSCNLDASQDGPELLAETATTGGQFLDIAQDGLHVFAIRFTGGQIHSAQGGYSTDPDVSTILRIPKTGGEPQILHTLDRDATQEQHGSIEVVGDEVFFTRIRIFEPRGGEVWRMGTDGADARRVSESNGAIPLDLAVDATHVYWSANVPSPEGGGKVFRVPRGGGPAELIASSSQFSRGIALDDSRVFVVWEAAPLSMDAAAVGQGRLTSSPKSGGKERVLLDRAFLAFPVTVAQGRVYCFEQSASEYESSGGWERVGRLLSISVDGGWARVLASDQRGPTDLTVTPDGSVVWTNSEPFERVEGGRDFAGELRLIPWTPPRRR